MHRTAALLMMFGTSAALADVTAITGGTVHTMGPAGTVENATILIDDGIITAVGRDVDIPADAIRIDADHGAVTRCVDPVRGRV